VNSVTAMRSPEDLLPRYALKRRWAIFRGTLTAKELDVLPVEG